MNPQAGLRFLLPMDVKVRRVRRFRPIPQETAPAPVGEPVEEEAPVSVESQSESCSDGSEKPFPDCIDWVDRGGCQTVLHQRYDGNRGDILRCKTCGRTFSTRRGGLKFRSRLSEELLQVLVSFHERGESIRKTARALQINRGTVRRYFRMMEEGKTEGEPSSPILSKD